MEPDKKEQRKRFREMAKKIKSILSSEDVGMKVDAAKIKALLIIYSFQTDEELNRGTTVEDNGMGFTAYDGDILTSFSQQLYKTGSLSPKQMKVLRNRIKKYWKQITQVSLDESTPTHVTEFMDGKWTEVNKWRYNS